MARFNAKEVDKYGVSGNHYFGLKEDKDTAIVRFMYNDVEDIQGYSFHEVATDKDYKKKVDCLRQAGDSKDTCPLCSAGYKVDTKAFLHVYNEDTGEMQIWERSKKYLAEIADLLEEYGELQTLPIKITRNGKKGSTSTTYTMIPLVKKQDDTTLEDYPELIDITEANILLELSYEQLEEIADMGMYVVDTENTTPKGRTKKKSEPTPKGRKVASKKAVDEDDEDEEKDEVVAKKRGGKKVEPPIEEDDQEDIDDLDEDDEEDEAPVVKKKGAKKSARY